MIQTATPQEVKDYAEDLKRIERALSEPLDPEQEAWNAARYRYIMQNGQVRRALAPRPGPGAMLMPPSVVTLFANGQAGNALATFTTEASMYAASQPNAILGANYFDPTYSLNRTLRVTCRGIYSTTGTPTFTIGFRQDTVSGAIWGTSLAVTSQSGVTNLVWELEFDITVASMLLASAHNEVTFGTWGMLSGVSTGSNGFTNGSAIGTQTPTTAQTLTQTDVSHFLFPTATCGTSSASNKWQMLQMIVQGLN